VKIDDFVAVKDKAERRLKIEKEKGNKEGDLAIKRSKTHF